MLKILLVIAAIYVVFGLPYHMDLRIDTVKSHKIHKPLRLCILSDLHCRPFGDRHNRIMELVELNDPDLVIIPGDLFDSGRRHSVSFELLEVLRGRTVFFTSGNHDNYLKEMDDYRLRMKEMGIHVLENESELFGDEIEITGLSDSGRKPALTAEEVNALASTDRFRILVSHRPNHMKLYREVDFDLIICGHAHGGQWRIPIIKRGLIGPQQGLFPKYTDGIHEAGSSLVYISRGLASGDGRIPRLYNNPEVGIINLEPEGGSES